MSLTIDNARVVVAISIDFEAEEDAQFHAPGIPDFWDYHERQYGGRRGVWRVLETLEKHEINVTFFICAALLSSYSAACREVGRRGYEIAAHTIHHEHLDRFTPEDENEMFVLMQQLFGEFYGEAPVGFRTCFPSGNTLDLVADHGFYYDSTTRDDDRPYLMQRPGRGSYIEIPRGFNGDAPWIGSPVQHALQSGRHNTPREALAAWRWEFDWLYREAAHGQKLVTLCLHPFIVGRPSRSSALDGLLDYLRRFPDVYFATHLEVAQHYERTALANPDAAGAR